LFFPENRRESVLGRLGIYLRGKTCVSSAKAYNAAAGLSKEGWVARLVLSAPGIVLTWAAKPKVRSVPLTPKNFSSEKSHLQSPNLPTPQDTFLLDESSGALATAVIRWTPLPLAC